MVNPDVVQVADVLIQSGLMVNSVSVLCDSQYCVEVLCDSQ